LLSSTLKNSPNWFVEMIQLQVTKIFPPRMNMEVIKGPTLGKKIEILGSQVLTFSKKTNTIHNVTIDIADDGSAFIELQDDGFYLTDAGAKTIFDGKEVNSPVQLVEGKIFEIGSLKFRILEVDLEDKYSGLMEHQLRCFEQKGKEIISVLLARIEPPKEDLKRYFSEEGLGEKKLAELRPQNAAVIDPLEKIMEQTFDEYEGLRQIKDFRGLGGPVGNYILKEGNRICGFFKRMFVVTIVMTVFKVNESPENRSKFPDTSSTSLPQNGNFWSNIII